MTITATTQAMTDTLYTVLETIFGVQDDTETFGMSVTPTEGKIILPTHVSLMGLGQLTVDVRKKLRFKFRGDTVTLIVSA